MIDRDYIEKSILLGVVKQKSWNLMILNHMEKKYFSFANHMLYDYIKSEMDSGIYPDIKIVQLRFNILKSYYKKKI